MSNQALLVKLAKKAERTGQAPVNSNDLTEVARTRVLVREGFVVTYTDEHGLLWAILTDAGKAEVANR